MKKSRINKKFLWISDNNNLDIEIIMKELKKLLINYNFIISENSDYIYDIKSNFKDVFKILCSISGINDNNLLIILDSKKRVISMIMRDILKEDLKIVDLIKDNFVKIDNESIIDLIKKIDKDFSKRRGKRLKNRIYFILFVFLVFLVYKIYKKIIYKLNKQRYREIILKRVKKAVLKMLLYNQINRKCPICYENLFNDDEKKKLIMNGINYNFSNDSGINFANLELYKCGHLIHKDCSKNCLCYDNKCPLCRTIDPRIRLKEIKNTNNDSIIYNRLILTRSINVILISLKYIIFDLLHQSWRENKNIVSKEKVNFLKEISKKFKKELKNIGLEWGSLFFYKMINFGRYIYWFNILKKPATIMI